MSEHAHSHDAGDGHDHDGHGDGHHRNYVKIWAILVVLLAISVTGPMLEIQIVTLITAFGIAIVKAYLVAKNFMHLDVEKPIVHYILFTCLAFMVLLFSGASPDIMQHEGSNWENLDAKRVVEAGLAEMEPGGDSHGDDSHDEPTHGGSGH